MVLANSMDERKQLLQRLGDKIILDQVEQAQGEQNQRPDKSAVADDLPPDGAFYVRMIMNIIHASGSGRPQGLPGAGKLHGNIGYMEMSIRMVLQIDAKRLAALPIMLLIKIGKGGGVFMPPLFPV